MPKTCMFQYAGFFVNSLDVSREYRSKKTCEAMRFDPTSQLEIYDVHKAFKSILVYLLC